MKAKYVVAGMAVSSLLGATAALAIAGDLNANGMKKSLSVLNAVQSKWVSSFDPRRPLGRLCFLQRIDKMMRMGI